MLVTSRWIAADICLLVNCLLFICIFSFPIYPTAIINCEHKKKTNSSRSSQKTVFILCHDKLINETIRHIEIHIDSQAIRVCVGM